MTLPVQIHESASLRQLAAAMISEAVRDVTTRNKPIEKRLIALFWYAVQILNFGATRQAWKPTRINIYFPTFRKSKGNYRNGVPNDR